MKNKKQFKNKNIRSMFDRIKSPDVLIEMINKNMSDDVSGKTNDNPSLELKKLLSSKPKDLIKIVKNDVDSFLNISGVSTPQIYKSSRLSSILESSVLCGITTMAIEGSFSLLSNVTGANFFDSLNSYMPSWLEVSTFGAFIGSTVLYEPDNSHYNNLFRLIMFGGKKYNGPTTIAHEYTHHVQSSKGLHTLRKYISLQEGHAVCVERIIGKSYSEKYTFPKLRQLSDELYTGHLNNAILALTTRDTKNISPYALGTAIFSIYEYEFGQNIYKDVLKDDFEWPKSTYIKS